MTLTPFLSSMNVTRVIRIKEKLRIENKFAFATMSTAEIMQEISRLDENKTTANGDIPVKILKICSDIISPSLKSVYDNTIETNKFSNELKLADVAPAHKKDDTTRKTIYCPISIFLSVSKIFERNMINQILTHIEQYLSPYLCGFRKDYNTQNCLIVMIEEWKKVLDNKKCRGCPN